MNYTHIFVALALCMCMTAAPVAATGSFYENKYVPTVNTVPTDGAGELNIQLACYHNLITKDFTIQRVDTENTLPGFTNGAVVSKEFAELYSVFETPTTIEFDHTGHYDSRLAPGTFIITIKAAESP